MTAWAAAGPSVPASFMASAVEVVEALTIVLSLSAAHRAGRIAVAGPA